MNFFSLSHTIPTHCIFLWQKILRTHKATCTLFLKQCATLKHTLAKEERKIVQCIISPALRIYIIFYDLIVHLYGQVFHNMVICLLVWFGFWFGFFVFVFVLVCWFVFFPFIFNLCRSLMVSLEFILLSIIKVPGTLRD